MTNATNNATNNATLAARAAGLLTKQAAYGVVEKALQQALAAKRVYPALAEDFGGQLGVELPLKTKDFVRVVGHLLSASEKPLKGIISKKKSDILGILAELIAALTDTPAIELPSWAMPKVRAKKSEAEANAEAEASADGALARANAEAAANEAAEALASAALEDSKVALAVDKAIAIIVANAATLTEEQRGLLLSVLTVEAEAA